MLNEGIFDRKRFYLVERRRLMQTNCYDDEGFDLFLSALQVSLSKPISSNICSSAHLLARLGSYIKAA